MAASDYLSWDQIVGQHEEVGVHLHAPLTRSEGFPVFSVVAGGKAIGQVTEGALENPAIKIDRGHLQEALNRSAKTRNTMIVGRPTSTPPTGRTENVRLRPGVAHVGEQEVFRATTGRGPVTVRETIPQSERSPGGPTQRRSEPFEGVTVPPQPSRSEVFAAGVLFGRSGVHAVVGDD